MKNITVFITGINSFVGSNLALFLKDKGYIVKGSLSDLAKASSVKHITNDLTQIKLGSALSSEAIPDDVDVLIYAAHDKNTAFNNIETNKRLFELAEKRGCQYHIFISSISANSSNMTDYGQVKLQLEDFFIQKKNAVIVRPGLVIGDGGLYSNMEGFVKKNHLIPLPDGGKYPMAIIEMNELAEAFELLLQKRPTGFVNLYQQKLISLKDLVKKIAKTHNKKVYILYIPINFTLFFFEIFKTILNLLKIKNKFSIDSVAGYKLYKDLQLPPSDLQKLKEAKTQ